MLIDTHAHITSKEFDIDRDEVIRRALDAGVSCIVNPATDLEDSLKAVELAAKHEGVYACVGFHPHDAIKANDKSLEEIEELSKNEKVVAIGEIGLDFHYDFSPRDIQQNVFRAQVEIARRRNLPIVIHTRESITETVGIVEEQIEKSPGWRTLGMNRPAPRGVFHCFTGDLAMANKVINLGFYISFPGMVTFKNAVIAQQVAGAVSIDHLLLETDSPYLAPVPLRGKRNEPANIPLIAAKIAELQHMSVEDIARETTYNAYDLFGIGEQEPRDAA